MDTHIPKHCDFGCTVCMKTTYSQGQHTSVTMMACSNCHGPRRYCSKECYKRDWGELGHKEECEVLASEIVINDTKKYAADVTSMKNKANELFRANKYEEAISLYRKVKTMAIKLEKYIRTKRKQRQKNKKIDLCSYINKVDSSMEDQLRIDKRINPLETEMARLAAIAANNSAITYNKMNMPSKAAALATEALKLDPLFAFRILPQLILALKGRQEQPEMINRYGLFENGIASGLNESSTLFMARFLSYKEMLRLERILFYKRIDKEKNRKDCVRFPSPKYFKLIGKWAYCMVQAVIIPFQGVQWLSLSINNFCDPGDEEQIVKLTDMRLRAVDVLPNHNDREKDTKYSDGVLTNACKELILFVHDLEREGMAVLEIALWGDLMQLCPEEKDRQRKGTKKGKKQNLEKNLLCEGMNLPKYCCLVPGNQIPSDLDVLGSGC